MTDKPEVVDEQSFIEILAFHLHYRRMERLRGQYESLSQLIETAGLDPAEYIDKRLAAIGVTDAKKEIETKWHNLRDDVKDHYRAEAKMFLDAMYDIGCIVVPTGVLKPHPGEMTH